VVGAQLLSPPERSPDRDRAARRAEREARRRAAAARRATEEVRRATEAVRRERAEPRRGTAERRRAGGEERGLEGGEPPAPVRVPARILRGRVARGLVATGAVLLFISLFLTWSHQFSPALLARYRGSDALRGVARDPTAWQLYSIADVIMALLAMGLAAVVFVGGWAARGRAARGSAVGGRAVRGSAVGGRAVRGSAVGGRAVRGSAVGGRAVRGWAVAATGVGLAFAAHATSSPGSNGTDVVQPTANGVAYLHNVPRAGAGATVAVVALVLALVGLVVSFTAD
jgi:hypothetical protein